VRVRIEKESMKGHRPLHPSHPISSHPSLSLFISLIVLSPIVGTVDRISPMWSLYRMVVLPAASRPSMTTWRVSVRGGRGGVSGGSTESEQGRPSSAARAPRAAPLSSAPSTPAGRLRMRPPHTPFPPMACTRQAARRALVVSRRRARAPRAFFLPLAVDGPSRESTRARGRRGRCSLFPLHPHTILRPHTHPHLPRAKQAVEQLAEAEAHGYRKGQTGSPAPVSKAKERKEAGARAPRDWRRVPAQARACVREATARDGAWVGGTRAARKEAAGPPKARVVFFPRSRESE
jgi:hypothetical protein